MAASSIVVETAAAEAEPPVSSLVTKAGLNKEATVNKALLDKYLLKKTGVCSAPEIRAYLYKYAEGGAKLREQKLRETPVVFPETMTKERLPDAYMERIKRRPSRKMSPLKDSIARDRPEYREFFLATNAHINYLVDVEQDCLRQYEEKGYAEIGVDETDDGLKRVFILPKPVVEVEGK